MITVLAVLALLELLLHGVGEGVALLGVEQVVDAQ